MRMAKHGRHLVRFASGRTAARSDERQKSSGGAFARRTFGAPANYRRRQRNRMRSWPEDRRRRSSAGSGRRRVKGWGKAPEASMRSRIRSGRDGKVGGRETECDRGQKIAGAGRARAQEGEKVIAGEKLQKCQ